MCVIYTAISSICVVSNGLFVACPTPPLFHQQPVSAEESGKTKAAEGTQAAPNKNTDAFSVAKASNEFPHA